MKQIKNAFPLSTHAPLDKGYHQRTVVVIAIECRETHDFVSIDRHVKSCVAKHGLGQVRQYVTGPWPHNVQGADLGCLFVGPSNWLDFAHRTRPSCLQLAEIS